MLNHFHTLPWEQRDRHVYHVGGVNIAQCFAIFATLSLPQIAARISCEHCLTKPLTLATHAWPTGWDISIFSTRRLRHWCKNLVAAGTTSHLAASQLCEFGFLRKKVTGAYMLVHTILNNGNTYIKSTMAGRPVSLIAVNPVHDSCRHLVEHHIVTVCGSHNTDLLLNNISNTLSKLDRVLGWAPRTASPAAGPNQITHLRLQQVEEITHVNRCQVISSTWRPTTPAILALLVIIPAVEASPSTPGSIGCFCPVLASSFNAPLLVSHSAAATGILSLLTVSFATQVLANAGTCFELTCNRRCARLWFWSIFVLFLLSGFNLEANVLHFQPLSEIADKPVQVTRTTAIQAEVATGQHVIANNQF